MSPIGGKDTYYYMRDGLGSIRNLVDSSETTRNTYDYYAFGKELGSWTETVTNRYTYTSREWDDESSQYYYRARYYSGGGRFSGRDPAAPYGYLYVLNSPGMFSDPFGLWMWKDGKRQGGSRATVIACGDTSFNGLAKMTMLDESTVKTWLRPYKAEKDVKQGDEFTVPNTVVIAIGDMASWARVGIPGVAQYAKTTLTNKGFNVIYFDWKVAHFTASQVEAPAYDTFGLVLFGHGSGTVGGKFANDPFNGTYIIHKWREKHEDLGDWAVPSASYYDGQLGLMVGKFCFATQGGWPNKVSANGVSWMGDSFEFSTWTWGIKKTIDKAK